MAFNPANSNLIVVSVVGGYPTVAVLDALTGDDRHSGCDHHQRHPANFCTRLTWPMTVWSMPAT